MSAKKPPKPTLNELHLAGKISDDIHLQILDLAVRLIQIQSEMSALETERGYNNSQGVRIPGLADQLERLLILHDLTEDGFRLENYSVIMAGGGGREEIDEHLLLAQGVEPEKIQAAKVKGKTWVSLQVRKDPERKSGPRG